MTSQCAKCGKFISRKSGTAVVRRVSGYFDPPEYEGLCNPCDDREYKIEGKIPSSRTRPYRHGGKAL